MKHLLYVEDDPINALVMKKLLAGIYHVVHVEDGESCLQLIRESAFPMILMDINLGKGKMDGVQVMKKIKSDTALSQVPVVAVTSYAMPEDEPRFLKEGFDGYLAKPVDRKILLKYIAGFLES